MYKSLCILCLEFGLYGSYSGLFRWFGKRVDDDGVDGISSLLIECLFNIMLVLSALHLQRPPQCSLNFCGIV